MARPPPGRRRHPVASYLLGAPWRDVPELYGPWQTCYDRFVRWRQDGAWEMLSTRLQSEADASGELEWTVSVDSTVARPHQRSAGARRAPRAGRQCRVERMSAGLTTRRSCMRRVRFPRWKPRSL